MGVVVQKYGGSSVADIEKIQSVAKRIVETRNQGLGVVSVVSAMGNTTNDLLALAGKITADPPGRELDMLVTVGERITMALLAMAIHQLGHDSVSFTGSQSGILTTASHSGARVVEVRPYRIQDELEKGKIVIVAGYQGVSYQREITTLGRGGSDTTAIALAAALGADYCEICSDVNGIMTSDPRVVTDAKTIDALSHDEMLEMSLAGARVLNADAVEYARRHGIAIYAQSTFGGPEMKGTMVRVDLDPARSAVTSVVGREDVVGLSCDPSKVDALLQHIKSQGVPHPVELTREKDAARLLFTLENAKDPERMIDSLRSLPGVEQFDDALGMVTLIGPGIFPGSPILEELRNACPALQDQPEAVSPGKCKWLVPRNLVSSAVCTLHKSAFPPS